eukprot:Rhum_TRINITY_DN14824_c12_g1::Rhum_TRINITY_DN14824_c12_g1_i1::g.119475::m.119475
MVAATFLLPSLPFPYRLVELGVVGPNGVSGYIESAVAMLCCVRCRSEIVWLMNEARCLTQPFLPGAARRPPLSESSLGSLCSTGVISLSGDALDPRPDDAPIVPASPDGGTIGVCGDDATDGAMKGLIACVRDGVALDGAPLMSGDENFLESLRQEPRIAGEAGTGRGEPAGDSEGISAIIAMKTSSVTSSRKPSSISRLVLSPVVPPSRPTHLRLMRRPASKGFSRSSFTSSTSNVMSGPSSSSSSSGYWERLASARPLDTPFMANRIVPGFSGFGLFVELAARPNMYAVLCSLLYDSDDRAGQVSLLPRGMHRCDSTTCRGSPPAPRPRYSVRSRCSGVVRSVTAAMHISHLIHFRMTASLHALHVPLGPWSRKAAQMGPKRLPLRFWGSIMCCDQSQSQYVFSYSDTQIFPARSRSFAGGIGTPDQPRSRSRSIGFCVYCRSTMASTALMPAFFARSSMLREIFASAFFFCCRVRTAGGKRRLVVSSVTRSPGLSVYQSIRFSTSSWQPSCESIVTSSIDRSFTTFASVSFSMSGPIMPCLIVSSVSPSAVVSVVMLDGSTRPVSARCFAMSRGIGVAGGSFTV